MGQRVGDSERLGVGESVGHGDVRVRESARRERVGESRRRVGNALFFSNPTHAERQRRVRGGMADVHAYALRRCATTGVGRWSAGRTRFQLTPDSASGDRVEREICTARRCRCRCIAGVRRRRRSAAHLRRLMSPDAVGGDGATRPLARSDSASGGVAHLRCAVGWGRGG